MIRTKITAWIGFPVFIASCFLQACMNPSPQPPTREIVVTMFYKTASGVDLLDQQNPNSYKQKDIKVVTRLEPDGAIIEASFNNEADEVVIYYDAESQTSSITLYVPTRLAKAIETLITLTPTITDTITYSFNSALHPEAPDKLYYNRKLVWELPNTTNISPWPPLTIIK